MGMASLYDLFYTTNVGCDCYLLRIHDSIALSLPCSCNGVNKYRCRNWFWKISISSLHMHHIQRIKLSNYQQVRTEFVYQSRLIWCCVREFYHHFHILNGNLLFDKHNFWYFKCSKWLCERWPKAFRAFQKWFWTSCRDDVSWILFAQCSDSYFMKLGKSKKKWKGYVYWLFSSFH